MVRNNPFTFTVGTTFALALFVVASASAQGVKVGPTSKDLQSVRDKAIGFLRSSQNPDGSFSPKFAGPGITSLAIAGLIRNGVAPDDPAVVKALKWLESQAKADGGIHNQKLANYTTSVAVMALRDANINGKYDAALKRAAEFLKKIQHDADDLDHGGFGYDKGGRPDMSNSAFTVEALLAAGLSKDDPAVKNALKFISRCQNLPGETNTNPWATKTADDDKGGFVYDPHLGDKNKYQTAAGGLRSLGAMTYSGLKSFLYAGVDKKDKRVEAAVAWARAHYTLEENPGMGKAGLYYYYHTFSKALDAFGEDLFEDAKGKKHDWRMELFQTLQKQQLANGSWRNMGERTFGEDNADLATSFALLSLSYCQKR
ncbi:MAG: terpene cyclase/mutase family protein [Planctomycetes bacterium]|nr:terpene cyclase/mutase family protein [Planctomycetota bacterium]